MYKIPISGGPHTGKTTLLHALREHLPEAYFVPEAAELVIAEQQQLHKAAEQRGQHYEPIVPVTNYKAFAPLVIAKSLELEADIPQGTDLAFLDRSLIDNIGYGLFNNHEVFIPDLERKIVAANYAFAFFCEKVGVYTQTDIRHEDHSVAHELHLALKDAYDESGLKVVHLPNVPVEERVEIVLAELETLE